MRISDWSSDVCSSDLFYHDAGLRGTHDGVPAETAAIRHDFVGEMAVAAGADGGGDRAAKIFVVFEFAKIGLDLIDRRCGSDRDCRSEEHTSELQSLMRISYAVFCLKKNISLPLAI